MPKHVFLWYAECGCCHSTGTLWTCQVTWPDVNPGVTPSDPSSELQQTLPENINTWAIRVQKNYAAPTYSEWTLLVKLKFHEIPWNSYIIDPMYIYIYIAHPPAPHLCRYLRAALASGVSTQRTVRESSRRSPSSVTRTSQKQRQLRLLLVSVSRTPAQNLGKNDHARGGGREVALCQGEYGAIFYWCLLLLLLLQSDIIVIIVIIFSNFYCCEKSSWSWWHQEILGLYGSL